MGEVLLMVLGVAILVGFVVGIVAYKPVRNKLIREKGYDADKSGYLLSLFSMFAIIGGCVAGTSGNRANTGIIMLGIGIGVVLQVFNIIKRIKPIGLGNAVLITLLQMLSMLWVCIAWFVKTVASLMSRSNNMADGTIARKNADEAKKAELMREYEASVAAIRQGSDEIADLTGETDAAIAAARDDYEREVSKVDHEYKG